MPKECAFAFCQNLHSKGNGFTFHSFPKDPQRRARWGYLMERGASWLPKDWDVVCSQHFCPEDFDRTGQTVRLRQDVEPSVFDQPEQFHKKRKSRKTTTTTTTTKRLLEAHAVVESQETSLSINPDFHTYSATLDDLLQKLRKAEDLNEDLQKQLRNYIDREKHFKEMILGIKEELREKNYLTKELEDRLSFYEESSGNSDNFVKPFHPELVEVKSEPVGHDEEEQQNGNLQDNDFVEIKCEPLELDKEENPFASLSNTSNVNYQMEALEMEDPLVMKEEVTGSSDI